MNGKKGKCGESRQKQRRHGNRQFKGSDAGTKAEKVVGRPETQAEIHIVELMRRVMGFPGCSNGKESAYSAGDLGSVPGSGRAPGEGNGYPLQYCCLKNLMDREAWRPTVHKVSKSQTELSC